MKRLLLICLMIGSAGVAGCGSDVRFSAVERDSITVGMSKADVEAKFGKPTTVIVSIGNQEAVQWVRGEGDSTSSINVSYVDGKVKEVIGTNLR